MENSCYDYKINLRYSSISELEEGVYNIKFLRIKKNLIIKLEKNDINKKLTVNLLKINPFESFFCEIDYEFFSKFEFLTDVSLNDVFLILKSLIIKEKVILRFSKQANSFDLNFVIDESNYYNSSINLELKKDTKTDVFAVLESLFNLIIRINEKAENNKNQTNNNNNTNGNNLINDLIIKNELNINSDSNENSNKTYSEQSDSKYFTENLPCEFNLHSKTEESSDSFNKQNSSSELKNFLFNNNSNNKNNNNNNNFNNKTDSPESKKLNFLNTNQTNKILNKLKLNHISFTEEKITAFAYQNNFNSLILGTYCGKLILYDLETQSKKCEMKAESETAQEITSIIELDQKTVACASADKTIKIWNLGLRNCEAVIENYFAEVQMIKINSRYFATYYKQETHISVLYLKTGKLRNTFLTENNKIAKMAALDENCFIAASCNGIVSVFDLKKKNIKWKFSFGNKEEVIGLIAIGSDLVAVSFKDSKKVEVIDYCKGVVLEGFFFEFSNVGFIAKHDDYLLVYEIGDWKIYFYDLVCKKIFKVFKCLKDKIFYDAFVLNEKHIVLRYLDKIQFYEIDEMMR